MFDMINADKAWVRDLEYVFKYGDKVSPRGKLVYETLALKSEVSMGNPVILNKRRNLGYKFMAAEAAWILGGDNRLSTIQPYSKTIGTFSDDGETFFGAYGPKVYDQIPFVVSTLHNDVDSRQAVINIWRENPGPSRDIPCTLSLQFLIRNSKLHCVASMRSSDLWLGHPYDIFNFSAVSFAVLLQLKTVFDLKLELGHLFLTAGSKHIYEKNGSDVSDIIEKWHDGEGTRGEEPNIHPVFVSDRYDDTNEFVSHLWDCANSSNGILTMFSGL